MDFKELQEKVVKNAMDYGQKHNVKIDEEFAQAILIHRKKCRPEKYVSEEISKKELAKELSDVVGMAIVNAHLLGIDLEQAINGKWINK